MSVHPQVKEVFRKQSLLGLPDTESMTPAEARLAFSRARANLSELETSVAAVEDRVIAVAEQGGAELPIRLYTPGGEGLPELLPVFVFFHGGGFVLGNIEITDRICRYYAQAASCIVVSVDYRLAPEHKFPTAVSDAYAATKWVVEHAASFNGDSKRIAVGGESACGNLAAVVSLLARDRGEFGLCCQLLIYPVVSFALDTASCRECGNQYNLTYDEMLWFRAHYLQDEEQINDPLASPLLAADLSGLPQAVIVTAEFDPLRDEGELYAERLASFGVAAKAKRYLGMVHSFFNFSGEVDASKEALAETAAELKRVFYT